MMQSTKGNDEKDLFFQIAKGDQGAFRELFDLYKERFFTFAYGLTHSKVDAEEIVQDIFLKLWEARASLTSIEYPQSYMFTMVRNRTLDLLAKIGRDQTLIKQVWSNIRQSEELTEQILQAKESQKLIQDAVAGLPERKQRIFELSRQQGLNHDEIADLLGLSKQTVKNNLSEALKQIKTYLEQHSRLLAIVFWVQYFELLFRKY
jgi:RNA polymerase sigma-70 factor (family 1)